ncbi:30S ribosomal protein S8 [Planctomycetes bacterium Pan216]|uniref:Small ribosomal subunit protein uS8 n=1 Tax=Kolteria novifilia TaxID=2527975 RepID=A0A518AZP4_9BACT|nr:30S ribosomal protein S8 [Planctomycetes bacterium Pan216]
MMTDPIADMLTRIRNAVRNEAVAVDVPYSKMKHEICKVFVEEGYVVKFEIIEREPQGILRLQLRYGLDGEHVIQSIRRISNPGRRIYRGSKELRPILGGLGITVLSTSHGIMSDRQARVRNVGGEVLCEVY